MEAVELHTPADARDMVENGETLRDRWDLIALTVCANTGMGPDAVVHDLLTAGIGPDLPELASIEACEAIVDGSVLRLVLVAGRVGSGVTVH